MPASLIDEYAGAPDPAETSRIAHETAQALLSRVRDGGDEGVVDRLVRYTDEHGIDTLAQLWSVAPSRSLPGVLWRLNLLRLVIRRAPEEAAVHYRRGVDELRTIDPVIAGAESPTGPEELGALADTILRGAYSGDFAMALERAASYCRVVAAGASAHADEQEAVVPARSSELTTRALRHSEFAADFASAARRWRRGALD
ncbi:DNA-directed RNA polymerase subunit beta [Mycetocola reblochoni]|uniref:DNA-directed RNA polymerase subunit beta n=3 Tax=Mycetocola reblochoni TaxID=331618 RepID=A0A1R4IQZ4_9MICO|nr:DNA-directed RNA polymerase subunit beta [Mycetocola reblochoni]SJN22266.1 hypothetical protein FM119_03105 [Mycetocola reblochoni REB411]